MVLKLEQEQSVFVFSEALTKKIEDKEEKFLF